ncbi:MAG: TIGR03792 family protein [Chloroflexi bacterium]|nr:TIGR03792 family protein [Chloroflexota bacterium]
MVVELLRFRMNPEKVATFLEKNAQLWTPALRQHRGFVEKEIWVNLKTPGEVLIAIHWETMADWKSFPAALQQELDAQMGDEEFVNCEGFEYEVVASTLRAT